MDQPLEELEGQGLYYNTLQYVPALQPWLVKYANNWGAYLSTEESWNEEHYQAALAEPRFHLDSGWYEDPGNWKSYNDFFSRKLSSPAARPIASPEDASVVASPADSECQGLWSIDASNRIVLDGQVGMTPKSTTFNSVGDLLHGSEYASAFAGGSLTHTFLNVDDYHRYHFPVGGTVKEVVHLPAQAAGGGVTTWSEELGKYVYQSHEPTWQSIETRGWVIVETEEYGLVAVAPIGMSQICSVNFADNVKPGAKVKKGDELGYFLFGGSDIVMLFQEGVQVDLQMEQASDGYAHVLAGEPYAVLSH